MSQDRAGPKGPITVWRDYGTEGWHWADFPSLTEALSTGNVDRSCVVTQPLDIAEHVREPAKPVGCLTTKPDSPD